MPKALIPPIELVLFSYKVVLAYTNSSGLGSSESIEYEEQPFSNKCSKHIWIQDFDEACTQYAS